MMNLGKITNWKPRNSWKYRLNCELQNIMMFGNPECSLNETMRLHLQNIGVKVIDESVKEKL